MKPEKKKLLKILTIHFIMILKYLYMDIQLMSFILEFTQENKEKHSLCI